MLRLVGKGNLNTENDELEGTIVDDPLAESDDERPESIDNKARQKEMRKGIDLATTLERIEKNFVITDPRLPDNPIVSTFLPCPMHENAQYPPPPPAYAQS